MKSIYVLFGFLLFSYNQVVNAQAVTLVTLGDSLTAGSGDEEGANLGRFPPRVLGLLQTDYPNSTLNNFAISGLTSVQPK